MSIKYNDTEVLHGIAAFRFLQASQQGVFLGRCYIISSYHLVISCPHAGLSGSRVMAHSFEDAFAEQRRPEWRYIAYDVLRLG